MRLLDNSRIREHIMFAVKCNKCSILISLAQYQRPVNSLQMRISAILLCCNLLHFTSFYDVCLLNYLSINLFFITFDLCTFQ